MSINDKSRKRVEDLFSGMSPLISEGSNGQDRHAPAPAEVAAHSLPSSVAMLQEMEALRARVIDLEARLKQKKNNRQTLLLLLLSMKRNKSDSRTWETKSCRFAATSYRSRMMRKSSKRR
ncbi:MAG: hypothetical protein IPP55_11340 [Anaerolineales bacterium]|nr:hypothetical protein [Anaerolineales bacterium]